MELLALVDDIALRDYVAIEPLHDEVEVVGIGYGCSGIGIGAHNRRLGYGGQLETAVDFLGRMTHRINQQTNLDGSGLTI